MDPKRGKQATKEAFAYRFCAALAELGIGPTEQSRLQRLFGVSGQAVRKWAEGSAMPTPARLPHVAQILGVRRAWLQDGEGPMRPGEGVAEEPGRWGESMPLTPEEARLLARYRMLSPEQRHALEVIIAAISVPVIPG